jgi:hypothetical protein
MSRSNKKILFERMKKLNPDFNYDVEEGIGDTYLEKKYGIPDEFADFDKKYTASKTKYDDITYQDDDWQIIKNPKNIGDLGKSVRGVITENGDLYIESYSRGIHNDILKILGEKGILPSVPKKNWTKFLPQQTGFLTVQRYKDSPYIAIGESNKLLYNEKDYNERIDYYREFLNRARSKMPNIKFIDRLVGTKGFKANTTGGNIMNESFLEG